MGVRTDVHVQMLAANSYQMTLLTGQNYQDNLQLYVLGGVFLASSIVWYGLFRFKPSVYVLSAPWLFFGIAFFLIAIPSLTPSLASSHTIVSDIATWSYAVSSAAAFAFFGLNFGEEAVRVVLVVALWISDTFGSIGCCHRGLGAACVYRTGFAANLDCGVVVLGKHAQWLATWPHVAVVDRVRPLALVAHVVYLCISHAAWSPGCVWLVMWGSVGLLTLCSL